MTYYLGSDTQEKERLELQAKLYADQAYLTYSSSDHVFELGCGNGGNLWIAEQLTHGHYIGTDIQAEQVRAAQEKATHREFTNTTFYVSDSQPAPIADNWADMAFCRFVLVHVSDPRPLIQELVRVAKPGGQVTVIEPNNRTYIAHNKPHLNKCYQARYHFMYQPGRGSLDICPQLYDLFLQHGLTDITIQQHSIYADARDAALLQALYQNWIGMVRPIKSLLIEAGLITAEDYVLAEQEAESIQPGDCLYQSQWIAVGRKVCPN